MGRCGQMLKTGLDERIFGSPKASLRHTDRAGSPGPVDGWRSGLNRQRRAGLVSRCPKRDAGNSRTSLKQVDLTLQGRVTRELDRQFQTCLKPPARRRSRSGRGVHRARGKKGRAGVTSHTTQASNQRPVYLKPIRKQRLSN